MPMENLRLSDFSYHLPKELVAQYPSKNREDARLLVIERAKQRISHQGFSDIVNYISCGDCLVLNNTKVVCARMVGRREKIHSRSAGGKQEIFLLDELAENTYRVLARPANKLTKGAKILFSNGNICASVLSDQGRNKVVKFSSNGATGDLWAKLGQVPLPPYIKRDPEDLDKQRYQTVYAKEKGATAAPTAGLHFTKKLLEAIRSKGVNIIYLTLHINYGTFAPVKTEDIRKHKMHKEYFILPKHTAEIINKARAKAKKVFAVGTTSVRVLEACADKDEQGQDFLREKRDWTDLFIFPPYRFKALDHLITNFHFPKSTLLMLVGAFAGKDLLFKAYQEAIEKRYRFFSYGDAMLIL